MTMPGRTATFETQASCFDNSCMGSPGMQGGVLSGICRV